MKSKYITYKDGTRYKVNTETGELIEMPVHISIDTEGWIMFYFQCISLYSKLTGNQMRLMPIIWQLSSFNPKGETEGNIFINGPYFKQKVREYGLDWSDSQINNEVSKIAKTDLMKKVARGTYILNSTFFFKGTITDRTKLNAKITNFY